MKTKSCSTAFMVATSTLIVIGAAAGVQSGELASSCEEPLVFSGAAVNNYVKPFTGVKDPTLPLDESGRMLGLLVLFDGLYSQIGHGSLGFINLVVDPRSKTDCSDKAILERVMGKRCCAKDQVRPGHAVTLLSGSFETIGDDIYLMLKVEFMRKNVEETVDIPLVDAAGENQRFTGRLPRTSVFLTPRRFTRVQLFQVADAYLSDVRLRESPSDSVSGELLEGNIGEGFSFTVLEARDDWMRIEPWGVRGRNRDPGWVKIPRAIGQANLRDLLPGLYFLDATAIYLQTVVAGETIAPGRYRRNLRGFEERREQFRRRAGKGGDQKALGLLDAMHGFMLLSSAQPAAALDQAAEDFAQAAELLPSNTDALGLAAISRFSISFRDRTQTEEFVRGSALPELEKTLLRIIDADPGDFYGKVNFERLCVLRQQLGDSGWETPDISRLRERLRADSLLLQKDAEPFEMVPRMEPNR